jgi:flagellar biosynthetic protein FliS
MNGYARSANAYLSQRILGASPEQQAALIMEAGQLHLGRAVQALGRSDLSAATSSYIRITEVIQEAKLRLDLENGGEAAHSLAKLYDWWTEELRAASRTKNAARLAAMAASMGEIRQAWEEYHQKKLVSLSGSAARFGERVG